MLIQVLPLPTITVGVFTETPFVLVIDGFEGETPIDMATLIEETGAASMIVSKATLDVGAPLELTDEQSEQIRACFEGALTP